MHEVSLMQEAVNAAIETARGAGGTRIHRLKLRVGTVSGVVPEALRFAFDVVTQGTMAEGASLEIEDVEATCWRAPCGAEFATPDMIGECPRCRAWSAELRRGTEMTLVSVEMS